jgi:hypothetical protein
MAAMTTTKVPKQKDAIAANAFAGRANPPTDAALAEALGASHSLWQSLVADLKSELKLDAAEWHSSSVKLGWSLRLQRKKRNIVYLGPRQGWFLAAFALGDKAVAVARKSQLPTPVRKMIAEARRYAEGTAVRIEVRSAEDAEIVKALARIKTEN